MLIGAEWFLRLDHTMGKDSDAANFVWPNDPLSNIYFEQPTKEKLYTWLGPKISRCAAMTQKVIDPLKKARYADLDEKNPELSNLQLCVSSVVVSKKSCMMSHN